MSGTLVTDIKQSVSNVKKKSWPPIMPKQCGRCLLEIFLMIMQKITFFKKGVDLISVCSRNIVTNLSRAALK
jgi:hypothetical protein